MGRLSIVLTGFCFVACFTASGADFPGGRCSFMAYVQGYSTCLTHYSLSLTDTGATLSNDFVRAMLNFHTQSCMSGLIDKMVTCIDQVNKMCDYSIVATSTLKGLADLTCTRTNDLLKLSECKIDISAIRKCFSHLHIDADNPVCSLTNEVTKCFDTLLNGCSVGAKDLVLAMTKAFSVGKCKNGIQSGKSCAYLPYFMSVTACYTPFGLKLPTALSNAGRTLGEQILAACQLSELSDSLACHHKVDARCGKSIVNTKKAHNVKTALCSATNEIKKLTICYNADLKGALSCIYRSAVKSTGVCSLAKAVRTCYKPLFVSCDESIQNLMDQVYSLIVPECNSGDSCSEVAYLGNLALCWTPSITGVMAKFFPKFNFGSCSSEVLTRGKKCQDQLDAFCKGSILRVETVHGVIKDVCDDNKLFELAETCILKNGKPPMTCPGINLLAHPVNNKQELCRSMRSSGECVVETLKKKACDPKVLKLARTVTEGIIPTQCSRASTITVSSMIFAVLTFTMRMLFW